MFYQIPLFLNLGTPELILIMFVALLLFGGKKLPELAKGLGKGLRDFKEASEGLKTEINNQINAVEEIKAEATAKIEEIAKDAEEQIAEVAKDQAAEQSEQTAEAAAPPVYDQPEQETYYENGGNQGHEYDDGTGYESAYYHQETTLMPENAASEAEPVESAANEAKTQDKKTNSEK